MNILFVTVFEVSEQKGGTERTTARISNELRKKVINALACLKRQ